MASIPVSYLTTWIWAFQQVIARYTEYIEVLKSIVGDDPAEIQETLEDFLDSLHHLSTEIEAARSMSKVLEVARLAHRFKSAARTVGAMMLGDICAELENAGRAEDSDAIDRLFPEYLMHLHRAREDILAWLRTEAEASDACQWVLAQ